MRAWRYISRLHILQNMMVLGKNGIGKINALYYKIFWQRVNPDENLQNITQQTF
jgi:hypothetical protein